MKKYISYALILCLLSNIEATVVWQGNITGDVTNENIEINGNCYLQQPETSINAINCDVTVEMKKDSVINAQQSAQYLYVQAIWPYSVTFKVHHNLEFRGVEGQPTESLQIYVYGNGSVRWEIDEDSTLKFNSTDNSGGVILWNTFYEGALPINIFKVSKQHQITFGKRCSIGFSVEDNCGITALDISIESDDINNSDKSSYIIMDETSQFALKLIGIF